VARQTGATVRELHRANPRAGELLFTGQVLAVPRAGRRAAQAAAQAGLQAGWFSPAAVLPAGFGMGFLLAMGWAWTHAMARQRGRGAGAFRQVPIESLEQLPRGEVVSLLQQERGKVMQLKGSMEALVQASQQQVKLERLAREAAEERADSLARIVATQGLPAPRSR
jgi:hypothetical protein